MSNDTKKASCRSVNIMSCKPRLPALLAVILASGTPFKSHGQAFTHFKELSPRKLRSVLQTQILGALDC
jgi:hypothetical protein